MNIIRPVLCLLSFNLLFWLAACGSSTPELIPLGAEVVSDEEVCEQTGYCVVQPPNCSEGEACTPIVTEPEPELLDIFKTGQHGTWYRLSAIGAVDAQTTSLALDFDGDGLNNDDETVANMWVADYPRINTHIAPPITMEIEVLDTSTSTSESITSDISSSDTESTTDQSSNKSHRNETNLKTVQYQDSYNTSSTDKESSSESSSQSTSYETKDSYSGQVEAKSLLGGGSVSASYSTSESGSQSTSDSSSLSTEHSESYGETKTEWKDVPFKNNSENNSWGVKSNEATKKATKFRSEVNEKTQGSKVIKADAGLIRAALRIKNESVNMPVKLSNILCSLMFQDEAGQLIPVANFRLKNDDYSLFDVEIYGGQTFGPYVVELANLNTNEIKSAIAKGYNPKIFIIDYKMTHVDDSNYKEALGNNFAGNNLKVIEENAKGRTAGVRIFAPGVREFFRVAAFDTDASTELCGDDSGITAVTPGITLEKALKRLGCNGYNIEFADFILDFSGLTPTMQKTMFHVRRIKSVNGFHVRLPGSDNIEDLKVVDLDNGSEAYYIKASDRWTEDDFRNVRFFDVHANGRFYNGTRDVKDGETIETFRFTNPVTGAINIAEKMEGVRSLIWAGDHYDIALNNLSEHIDRSKEFGLNPIESGETVILDTLWDNTIIGPHPYYPEVNSAYLGQALLGEKIQIEFKLDSSAFIDPNFDTVNTSTADTLANWTYTKTTTEQLFNFDEVLDFEVSLGTGGDEEDWHHIIYDTDGGAGTFSDCGQYIDFQKQIFTQCLQLPTSYDYLNPEAPANIYLRPSLNQAYRNRIWLRPNDQVYAFTAKTKSSLKYGQTKFVATSGYGEIVNTDTLRIFRPNGSYTAHGLTQVTSLGEGEYEITLSAPLTEGYIAFTELAVHSGLDNNPVNMAVTSAFSSKWNTESNEVGLITSAGTGDCGAGYGSDLFQSYRCLGHSLFATTRVEQLIGPESLIYDWGDASRLADYLSIYPFTETVYPADYGREPLGEISFQLEQTEDAFLNDDNVIEHRSYNAIQDSSTGNNYLAFLAVNSDGSWDVRIRQVYPEKGDYFSESDTIATSFASGHAAVSGFRGMKAIDTSVGPRIIVKWQNGTALEARIFDLSGTVYMNDAVLFDEGFSTLHRITRRPIRGSDLLQIGHIWLDSSLYHTRLTTVDLATQSVQTKVLTSSGSAERTRIVVANGYAPTPLGKKTLGSWFSISGGTNQNIGARIVDENGLADFTGFNINQDDSDLAVDIDYQTVCWDSGPYCAVGYSTEPTTGNYFHKVAFVDMTNGGVEEIVNLHASAFSSPSETALHYAGGTLFTVQFGKQNGEIHFRRLSFSTLDKEDEETTFSPPDGTGSNLNSTLIPWGRDRLIIYHGSDSDDNRYLRLFDVIENRVLGAHSVKLNTFDFVSSSFSAPRFGDYVAALYETDNTNLTSNKALMAVPLDMNTFRSLPYGRNHFFTAPLVRRTFSVTAQIVP